VSEQLQLVAPERYKLCYMAAVGR